MVDTTSMNAASSSATRVIPNGAVQPPTCITIVPFAVTCSSMISSTTSWVASTPTEITRCTRGRREATSVTPGAGQRQDDGHRQQPGHSSPPLGSDPAYSESSSSSGISGSLVTW